MDQYQAQHLGAAMAGMMGMIMFFGVIFLAFMIFCLWRIFTKAGLAGPLALLVLFPGVGSLVVLCILAFAHWNVVPAPPQYGTLPPNYPPSYPPLPPNPPSSL
jgi:uncharacterized membrane protein YhaH (DUF805 family)